MMYMFTSFVSL